MLYDHSLKVGNGPCDTATSLVMKSDLGALMRKSSACVQESRCSEPSARCRRERDAGSRTGDVCRRTYRDSLAGNATKTVVLEHA